MNTFRFKLSHVPGQRFQIKIRDHNAQTESMDKNLYCPYNYNKLVIIKTVKLNLNMKKKPIYFIILQSNLLKYCINLDFYYVKESSSKFEDSEILLDFIKSIHCWDK